MWNLGEPQHFTSSVQMFGAFSGIWAADGKGLGLDLGYFSSGVTQQIHPSVSTAVSSLVKFKHEFYLEGSV